MKNLIKRIIREGILSKQRGIIPDMAGRITSGGLKKSDYIGRGDLQLRTEFKKLVVKFIKDNHSNELERYKGNFMYKLNKSIFILSEDEIIKYDSIFLKAVNSKDGESIRLANQFLKDIESGNISKSRNFNRDRKVSNYDEIKEQYKELKQKINYCNKFLNTELTYNKWDTTKYGYSRLHSRFIGVGYKLLDEEDIDELRRFNNISGEKAGSFLKVKVSEKLIELKNEMQMMINKYGQENLG